MIAIIAAMSREAEIARVALGRTPESDHVLLRTCGIGAQTARSCIRTLVTSNHPPGMVLSLGFAGATSPQLQPGQLFFSARVCDLQGNVLSPSPLYLDIAQDCCQQRALSYAAGDGLTVPRLVTNPEEKRRLASATRCDAVNMEDWWLASEASAASIPFLSVRAIVDEADQGLPPFAGLLGRLPSFGQAPMALGLMALMPWSSPSFFRLKTSTAKAGTSLASFIQSFIPAVLQVDTYLAGAAQGGR